MTAFVDTWSPAEGVILLEGVQCGALRKILGSKMLEVMGD